MDNDTFKSYAFYWFFDCSELLNPFFQLLKLLCTLIDCQLRKTPLGPQLPELHTGVNRQTAMVFFFG
jgi:hypothetical protein